MGPSNRRLVALLATVLIAFPAVSVDADPTTATVQDPARLIIFFDDHPADLHRGDRYLGAPIVQADATLGFIAVRTDDPRGLRQAALEDPRVDRVTRDGVLHLSTHTPPRYVPNDPQFGGQYGPQQIHAPGAWYSTSGGDARSICVVDSGVRYTHEDLQANYVEGYNAIDGTNDPWDDNGHGTHVTGIAAATIGNLRGIAGVANAPFYAVKAFSSGGRAYDSDVAVGVRWCAGHADIISMSFGAGPLADTDATWSAIRYADSQGTLMVAAAGNTGGMFCIGFNCGRFASATFPANLPEVIAVSCVGPSESYCEYSASDDEVELAAPGDNILSTTYGSDVSYGTMSGTSMSAPHVSGVAALVWNANPDLTADEVRRILRENTKKRPWQGHDNTYGWGIVDAQKALAVALRRAPPDAPVSESFDDGSAQSMDLTGLWHVDDACAAPPSPPNYLGYHREGACDYDVDGLPTIGDAKLQLDLTDAVWAALRFDHRWITERSDDGWDDMYVFAQADGGTQRLLARWDATDPNQEDWQPFEVPLNWFLGQRITAWLRFDSGDGGANAHPGWHVDNLRALRSTNVLPVAVAGPDLVARDGDGDGAENVTLDGSASKDPQRGGSVVAHVWRENGTLLATGATPTVRLPTGTHNISLTVTDDDGGNDTDRLLVTVHPNEDPQPAFTSACTQWACTFDAGSTEDIDGTITRYTWDLGDGTTSNEGPLTTHSYGANGTYNVTLTVEDDGGATASTMQQVTVENAPPTARFEVTCDMNRCEFDAAASTDPEVTLTRYTWDLGDGNRTYSVTPEHRYGTGGVYGTCLTVNDGFATDTTCRDLRIQAPVLTERFHTRTGHELTLTGRWHVDDGCTEPASSPLHLGYYREVTCDYETTGSREGSASFTVNLTNATSATLEFNHRLLTHPVMLGREVLRLQARVPGEDWSTLRTWRSGGDAQPEWGSASANLTPYASGPAEVRLHFREQAPEEDEYFWGVRWGSVDEPVGWYVDDVIVYADAAPSNLHPVARFHHVCDGRACTFNATASSDDGSVTNHTWDLGDGHRATGPTPDHTYGENGTFEVTLTVTDGDGATGTVTHRVRAAEEDQGLPSAPTPPDARDDGSDGHHTFDASPEGYRKAQEQPLSEVAWDPLRGRLQVLSNRMDPWDELLVHDLGGGWTPGQGDFNVSAHWGLERQGNWQNAFPLFLGPADLRDVRWDDGVAAVRYQARDLWKHQDPEYDLLFRTANGTLCLSESFTAPPGQELEFRVAYDDDARTLSMEARGGGATLARGECALGNATAPFAFEVLGVGTDGAASSYEPVTEAWVDEVHVEPQGTPP